MNRSCPRTRRHRASASLPSSASANPDTRYPRRRIPKRNPQPDTRNTETRKDTRNPVPDAPKHEKKPVTRNRYPENRLPRPTPEITLPPSPLNPPPPRYLPDRDVGVNANFEPQTRNPRPQTPNPKPQIPNSKPQTPNPKPQTPNPKPQTSNLNPRPRTQSNPEPGTRRPKPQTPIPKPESAGTSTAPAWWQRCWMQTRLSSRRGRSRPKPESFTREGRGACLCWAKSKPRGPNGSSRARNPTPETKMALLCMATSERMV